MVRIHLCQILYNPAYFDGNSDLLEEPAPSIDVTRTMGQLRQVKSVEGLLVESRASYVKHITEKLCAIARWSQSRGAKILVLPEYSVPCEALPHLRDIAREARILIVSGTHRVRFTETSKEIYKNIGLDIKTLKNGSAIAPIIHPTTGKVEIFAKRYRSKWEPNLDVSGQTSDICEVSLDNRPLRIGVAICIDALHVEILGSLWTDRVSKPHIIICPSLSPSVEQFANVGKILAGQETLFAYVNSAEFGGTAFNIPKEWEPYLPGTRMPGSMLHKSEAILEIDVNAECFFIKKRSVETAPPCSSTRYFPIVYAATGKWMDRYSALEKQVLELLNSGDSGRAIERVDSLLSEQEAPLPNEVVTKLHELRQGQLALFAGDVNAVRESLMVAVLPKEIDDPRHFFGRRIEQVTGLLTAALKSATGELNQSIINYLGALKSMQDVSSLAQLELPAEKPKAPLPKHLADKILAARPSLGGERKQVTVLFADVADFTKISQRMDPEEVHDLISECLVFLTEEIHRYEGTIAQSLGGGLLALFGAPMAREDAPQRALYAALGMQELLRDYAQKLKRQGIEFHIRIGLNTGLVVVGKIGDDLTMEYTAMGDTVNLASRMESTAEPNTIQVSENTYRLTEGYFEFKSLGKIKGKGKKEQVRAYQLLGVGHIKTRLGVAEMRGLTPFVGRMKELEQLRDCYERAKKGQGQVVGIVGEPGVGKSRLLLHMRAMLPQEEHIYLEGRCIHYGGSMAFLPFLDVLRSYFDIKEGEREYIIKKDMAEKVSQLDEKVRYVLPPLQDILSLKVEDEDYLKLEPALKRVRIFEAIRDLLVRESQNKPLVLAIEDLHWIDQSSEEFLGYFIGGLASSHIFLLILYRPEYNNQWTGKTYYTQIRVDELSLETSAEMVQAILKEGRAAQDLSELILNRAAGNPLFMEEFTHSLIERGYIERKNGHYVLTTKPSEIQVPDTIQGIIAARMDRLEEDLKRTMQVASVIGRDFAYRILQIITGMQQELKSRLLNLQELEFIYEKSLFPELEYVFKHALTQEVAYNSLLLKRRKEIHERIGKAIEELYPDRLAEFYEMLAYHYASGESWEKAYQYLKLSGDKTLHTRSRWEPLRFYREALQALRKLPDTEENKRREIEVGISLIGPMQQLFFPEDSLEILQEGERLSRELGDERSLAKFHGGLGMYYTFRDSRQAREYLEDAFREAEKAQDLDLMVPIGVQICTMYPLQGDFLKLADATARVIALLESTQRESHYFGLVTMPYSYLVSLYGVALAALGNFQEGRAQCEKALRFSTRINDMGSINWAECYYSFLFALQGDGKGAIEHAQQAIKYAEQLQIVTVLSLAWHFSGFGHLCLGDYENALKYMEKAQEVFRDLGMPVPSIFSAYVCMIYIESGDLANARSYAEKALESAQQDQGKWAEGLSSMCLGLILGMQDKSRLAEAEACLLRGIKIVDELKLRPFYALGYLYLGELYAHTGQGEKARENLQKAEAMYREMDMEYYLRRTQSELAKLQG